MAALITSQRYNWMGYNGTESEEFDRLFIRGGDVGGLNDYWYRRGIVDDIKKRFYLIKGDLDLIPEDELRVEREAARKRREEREAAERVGQLPDKESDGVDYQSRHEEEEKKPVDNALDERLREIMQRTNGISEEESNNLLENMSRTQEEVDHAVGSFSAGTRGLLVSQGAYYVSYLDGSWHSSLEKLDQHNAKYRESVERALEGTGVEMPSEDSFSTTPLHEAVNRLEVAQQKLQACFCQNDRSHVMCLRKADKDEKGNPIMHVTEEDGDEKTLLHNVDDAQADAVSLREGYNKRCSTCGQHLVSFAINSEHYYGMPVRGSE